jgi:UPF0716 protein FxsA
MLGHISRYANCTGRILEVRKLHLMRLALFIAFIVFPMLEIALLVKLGSALGFWPSFGIVVGTGLLGSTVLRHQGFAAIRRSQEALAEGHPPVEPVLDGLFLIVAGLLLITPGFISDIIGVFLLVPPIRKVIAKWAMSRFLMSGSLQGSVFTGSTKTTQTQWRTPGQSQSPRGTDAPIIEGEYERLDEKTVPPRQTPTRPPGS